MGRETRGSVNELRAVAALIVTGPSPQLVGPCTLVTNGEQTIAFSSSELLRAAPEPLAIALTFDCKVLLPVTTWAMSRTPHLGIIELGTTFPRDKVVDVEPATLAGVSATIDTRGAPAALVTFQKTDTGVTRRMIHVHVDAIDGGGMADDVITRLASPVDAADAGAEIDGAPLIAWLPADPVLGRPPEVVIVGLGCTYRQKTFQPREHAALAELWALDDLGRIVPWRGEPQPANDLAQIAGEIRDLESGPTAVPDREGD